MRPAKTGRPTHRTREHPMKHSSVLLLAVLLLAGTRTAAAQQGNPLEVTDETFILHFPEPTASGGGAGLSIMDFIKICEQNTGYTFIIDESAQGVETSEIRIVGKKEVPKDQFFSFFQNVLRVMGLATMIEGSPEKGTSLIAIRKPGAGASGVNLRTRALFVLPEEIEAYADQPGVLIQSVIKMKVISDASQALAQLQTIFGGNARTSGTEAMVAVGNDSMYLVGFGPTVASMKMMIDIIDQVRPDPDIVFDVIPLRNANADELTETLKTLMTSKALDPTVAAGGRPNASRQGATGNFATQRGDVEILADRRTNALLVLALRPQMNQIHEYVARLDTKTTSAEGDFHVYQLKHTKAKELAEGVKDFIERAYQARQASARTSQGGGNQALGADSMTRDVVVQEELVSNSILISASRSQWQEIQVMLDSLDKQPNQVLVQMAMVELTGDQTRDLGVEIQASLAPGADGPFGLTSFGLSSFVQDATTGDITQKALTPDLLGGGLTGGFLDEDGSFPVLMHILQTDESANILSIPSVLVNDNNDATIQSKDEFPTTEVNNTASVGQTVTFGGYEEAGITLKISPSISEDGAYVRMGINMEISKFTAPFVSGATIPPSKISRIIDSEVVIPDGRTMVIGGVVIDDDTLEITGIPYLMDIPWIGHAFKRTTTSTVKRTLYFFITPIILEQEDFSDLAALSYQKKLEALDVVPLERMRMVDPKFDGGAGLLEASEILDSGAFDIPIYRSRKAGSVEPGEVGVTAPQPSGSVNSSETLDPMGTGD